jgi:preprotein translocase subunit SecG
MPYLINALLTLNVIVCLLIILLVLMQRPRNEGLGAAFGGGVTEGLFGTQTTHVLARLTRWLGGIFFVLTLVLGILYSRNFATKQSAVQKGLVEAPVPPPAATPTPVTPLPGATPGTPEGTATPLPETPAPGTPAPGTPAPVPPRGGPTPPPGEIGRAQHRKTHT